MVKRDTRIRKNNNTNKKKQCNLHLNYLQRRFNSNLQIKLSYNHLGKMTITRQL